MKIKIVLFLIMISLVVPSFVYAENLTEPEIVKLESVSVDGLEKTIHVGNNNGHYTLTCTIGAENANDPKYKDTPITMCTTPKVDTGYWVYNNETKWKMVGAKEPTTLQFFKDWSVEYKGENIALIPMDDKSNWGIYRLKSWKK